MSIQQMRRLSVFIAIAWACHSSARPIYHIIGDPDDLSPGLIPASPTHAATNILIPPDSPTNVDSDISPIDLSDTSDLETSDSVVTPPDAHEDVNVNLEALEDALRDIGDAMNVPDSGPAEDGQVNVPLLRDALEEVSEAIENLEQSSDHLFLDLEQAIDEMKQALWDSGHLDEVVNSYEHILRANEEVSTFQEQNTTPGSVRHMEAMTNEESLGRDVGASQSDILGPGKRPSLQSAARDLSEDQMARDGAGWHTAGPSSKFQDIDLDATDTSSGELLESGDAMPLPSNVGSSGTSSASVVDKLDAISSSDHLPQAVPKLELNENASDSDGITNLNAETVSSEDILGGQQQQQVQSTSALDLKGMDPTVDSRAAHVINSDGADTGRIADPSPGIRQAPPALKHRIIKSPQGQNGRPGPASARSFKRQNSETPGTVRKSCKLSGETPDSGSDADDELGDSIDGESGGDEETVAQDELMTEGARRVDTPSAPVSRTVYPRPYRPPLSQYLQVADWSDSESVARVAGAVEGGTASSEGILATIMSIFGL